MTTTTVAAGASLRSWATRAGEYCLSARDRAATGTAVARGPAPDGGAARGAAGAGRPAAIRPGATAARARRGAPGGKRGPDAGAEGVAEAGGRAASPAKRAAQELPGVPPPDGTSAGGSTPAPAALSAEEPARGIGGARTSAVAALPVPPSGRVTCGGSNPVRAKPVAVAPGTATSAAKSVADCGSHATVPTPPADQCMPTALAAVDRGRSAPSPAKRAGVAQLDGHSRPQPEAAGVSGGSTQPPDRTRRSRYIPAPVRREVWLRDGGCCSYVDPYRGRRCGSRFLLELDHIVPFALGGSAEPGNLRVYCAAHNRFRHRECGSPPDAAT